LNYLLDFRLVWIHYVAGKIARGELFEVEWCLSYIRSNVIGPMVLSKVGARPQGVRRLEKHLDSDFLNKLKLTLPTHDPVSCFEALKWIIEIYQDLRKELIRTEPVFPNQKVISEVKKYLSEIENELKK
jgi:hypothetical protein